MGISYAIPSLIAIVAEHGEGGLTKEQIFEINRQTYRTPLRDYFDQIDPAKDEAWTTPYYIKFRDNKYFLKADADKSRLEEIIKDAERIRAVGERIRKMREAASRAIKKMGY